MNKLKIGGKQRPFSFTANAFEEFSINYDIPLAEIGTVFQRIRIDHIYDLAFLGLSEGGRVSATKIDFDKETVKRWMSGKIAEIMAEVLKLTAKDLGLIFGTEIDVEAGNVEEIAEVTE